MRFFIKLLFASYLSFFRRWFGGGFDKLSDNRAFQNCLNVVITFGYLFFCGVGIWRSVIASLCLQFLYFCPAHGSAFDIGRDYPPSEETIKRYKKYFWNKLCEFLVPKKLWYGFGYDFLWMMFRYEIPSIFVAIILKNFWFSFCGIFVAFIYAFCWSLYDKGKIKSPTELAEYISGFVSGLLI